MQKRILVPKEREAVLIGRSGKTKKGIEKATNTKISVSDDVCIDGDAIDVLTATEIVKAIGRGFSPENALELKDEETCLIIIQLPKDEKILKRIRSRLIGTRGKVRRNIETYTGVKMSVYGKTVSVIGSHEGAELASAAIEKIIKGLQHKSVYAFLEERRK